MIFAANFKTNHTRATTKEYIHTLSSLISETNNTASIYLFPPSTALDNYEITATIGAQNAYPAKNGAYTGEIGLEQLEEFGIQTILIGHSERREIIGESQEIVANKFNFFKENGFEIIYCIGEPLEVRELGEEAVVEHLLSQFEGIDTAYDKLIIAYEPIWAIGTGRSATVQEITSTHQALKQRVNKPLLYGGSVNLSNIKEIISIDGVDGVLVGSASLNPKNFFELTNN